MVDVGLSQAIVKRLNRWYRSRSRPQGTVDHFYRGIRLSYNAVYRGALPERRKSWLDIRTGRLQGK